jgi:hypothetical protein
LLACGKEEPGHKKAGICLHQKPAKGYQLALWKESLLFHLNHTNVCKKLLYVKACSAGCGIMCQPTAFS